MGIDGLTKFVLDKAPRAIQYLPAESLMSRTVAVDASLSLYQFMVAIRDANEHGNLQNAAGEVTSHISGMLARATRILELGVKPVYVFDGKPPLLKTGELAKRKDRKAAAETALSEAKEEGDQEKIKKYAGRIVKVTRQHNEDVKRLLRLMGIPIVEAPGEAEAQCAALCKAGMVYATATEDADALCFGTPVLVRRLQFGDPKEKNPKLMVINLQVILEDLALSMDQFIDFCILCGCDYADTIKGVGPTTAYKLIREHECIEKVLESLDKEKFIVPDNFPYGEARSFFQKPDVILDEATLGDLCLGEIDAEGLRKFLIEENQFSTVRVENAITRLKKARLTGSQTRLENFFTGNVRKSLPSVGGGVKRQSSALASGLSKPKKRSKK